MDRNYSDMTTGELEGLRELTLDRVAAVPQFRRGSLQVGYRKCGKKNCRCAAPGAQGHGPRGLWTRTAKGQAKSRGQYIPVDQIDDVRTELDNYAQFADLIDEYIEINEELCRSRIDPPGSRKNAKPAGSGKKGGSHSPKTGPVRT